MQTCRLLCLQFLLNTPFDHQPIAVPSVPTARSVIEDIIPPKSELSRVDEVGLLLKHLPAACDKAKQLQHDAQYASRYYRARFNRGTQLQLKHATHIAALSSPAEVQQWARSRLYPISNPFQCNSDLVLTRTRYMLRRTSTQLAPVASVGLAVVGAGDSTCQRKSLQRLLRVHDEGVAANAQGSITVTSTYDVESALYYDQYNMAVLPCVSGGAARHALRTKLVSSGAVAGVQERLLAPWQGEGDRRVVVFGCRSVAYLTRQLLADTTHSFLIVDSSLKELMGAAAALTPAFAKRVFFLRCESMFTCLQVLQPETADVAVVPMPVPFWSKHSSHRRLVHFDFYCAAHRVLKVRDGPSDPRGVVLFTDCEPYAAFMMEHLEEAKLVVPYTRKNPVQLFQRWLPQDELLRDSERGVERRRHEFPKQREEEVVALAAAKSGGTTPDANRLLSAYDYSRKYYRSFSEE